MIPESARTSADPGPHAGKKNGQGRARDPGRTTCGRLELPAPALAAALSARTATLLSALTTALLAATLAAALPAATALLAAALAATLLAALAATLLTALTALSALLAALTAALLTALSATTLRLTHRDLLSREGRRPEGPSPYHHRTPMERRRVSAGEKGGRILLG
jgi:hypothetical protein